MTSDNFIYKEYIHIFLHQSLKCCQTIVTKICIEGVIFCSLTINYCIKGHQCTETVNFTVNLIIINNYKLKKQKK